MNIVFAVCRLFVIFTAAAGFLFGQLYFASFEWPATAAGIFGLLAGALSGQFTSNSVRRSFVVIAFCIASVTGVAFDAYEYYAHLNIPGNYYAWFLIGPYVACLLLIIWKVWSNRGYDMPIKMLFSGTSNGMGKSEPGCPGDPHRSKRIAGFVGFLMVVIYNFWTAYQSGHVNW
jgi:hypothetical protein